MRAIDACKAVNRLEDAGTTRRTAEVVEIFDAVSNTATADFVAKADFASFKASLTRSVG